MATASARPAAVTAARLARLCLAAALPVVAAKAAAQDGFRFEYDVRRAEESRREPSVSGHLRGAVGGLYGGLRAGTLPGPDRTGELDAYLGLHPEFGGTTVDLSLSGHVTAAGGDASAVALSFARPIGDRGSLGARFRLDPEDGAAWTRAQAGLRLGEDFRLDGSVGTETGGIDRDTRVVFDLGASYAFADTPASSSSVTLRFEDAAASPASAELRFDLQLPFR